MKIFLLLFSFFWVSSTYAQENFDFSCFREQADIEV
jgi:hypothetical protein